jgi:hypothetical protein
MAHQLMAAERWAMVDRRAARREAARGSRPVVHRAAHEVVLEARHKEQPRLDWDN